MLMSEWWHRRPVIVAVRGSVSGQHVSVLGHKDQWIADFNGIAVARRQLREKGIQARQERRGDDTCSLKLEHERPDMTLKHVLVWRQYFFDEHLGVKKARVRLSGLRAIPWMIGEAWDRDVFPHLRAHLKAVRQLLGVVRQ